MAIKLRMAPQFLLLLLILNGNYGPIKIPKHCSEAVGAEHYMPVTGNGYMYHIRLSKVWKCAVSETVQTIKKDG